MYVFELIANHGVKLEKRELDAREEVTLMQVAYGA